MLVGGTLLGIIGALIAIPIAVAIGLILDDAVFPAFTDARERYFIKARSGTSWPTEPATPSAATQPQAPRVERDDSRSDAEGLDARC